MNAVFVAFTLNYPGKTKQRDNLVDNDGITDIHQSQTWDFHNSHIGEIISPNGDRLITLQRSQFSGQYIWDVYLNDWLNGEEIIAIKSTLPEGQAGALWTPPIPIVARNLDLETALGRQWERQIEEKDIIDCQTIFGQNITWGNKISEIGIYNFGYDVGVRWYIVISSLYGIIESVAWDLGPAINQFEPRYGELAYRHEHPDGIEVEVYSKIVDFSWPNYPCLGLL